MHFFGSNPDSEPPGGSTDIIYYFRFHLDPTITMQAGNTKHFVRRTRFAEIACISVSLKTESCEVLDIPDLV